MTAYYHRPTTVEAIQYRPGPGGNCDEVAAFCDDCEPCDGNCTVDEPFYVNTPIERVALAAGDWVLRDQQGWLYKVDAETFADNYERVQS